MPERHLTLLLNQFAPLLANSLNRTLIPPSLQTLIRKARFEEDLTGSQRWLWRCISEDSFTDTDLPDASLYSVKPISMCVAPCHLLADRDTLRLFHRDLAITNDEAEQLISLIQPLLDAFCAQLHSVKPDVWLLDLAQRPQVSFTALDEVNGQSISDSLPRGPNASDWIRLWNEIQMQLFDCEVNRQREQQGKLAINGVWFWSNLALPSIRQHWKQLSGLPALPFAPQQDVLQQSVDKYQQLIQFPALHSGALPLDKDWQSDIQQWEQNWFRPLLRDLRSRKLSSVELIVPQWGRYLLTPISLWRFWR